MIDEQKLAQVQAAMAGTAPEKEGFDLDAMSVDELRELRDEIDRRLPEDKLSQMDLTQELLSQYRLVQRLQSDVLGDEEVPANQRAQVAGQVVDAKEVLFEIVDTSRLAVEALAYDASLGSNVSSANAIAAQTNQSNSAGNLSLKYIGSGQQLRDQALPMLFRIQTNEKNNNSTVAVGQPVKVIVRTSQTIQGAQVNSASITKTKSGETMVWVHKEAERFIPIRVKQQSLDANTVAITQGLHEGDRVVVLGASLLSEVR